MRAAPALPRWLVVTDMIRDMGAADTAARPPHQHMDTGLTLLHHNNNRVTFVLWIYIWQICVSLSCSYSILHSCSCSTLLVVTLLVICKSTVCCVGDLPAEGCWLLGCTRQCRPMLPVCCYHKHCKLKTAKLWLCWLPSSSIMCKLWWRHGLHELDIFHPNVQWKVPFFIIGAHE